MAKQIQNRVSGIRIDAVRNGFRVKVGDDDSSGRFITIGGTTLSWVSSGGVEVSGSSKSPKVEYLPAASGEYVFPDFASLSAWLKANLKHGGGVEP